MKKLLTVSAVALGLSLTTISALAQDNKMINVTQANYNEAETARQFLLTQARAGGVNKWQHFRVPSSTDLDKQQVIRMNRDTLYSFAIINVKKGAKIVMPDSGDRYMSLGQVTEQHWVTRHDVGGGTYKILSQYGDHVFVVVRTELENNTPEDVAKVNALQDQMKIISADDTPYVSPNYDKASLKETHASLLKMFSTYKGNANGFFGMPAKFGDDAEKIRIRTMGTAIGWGGSQPEDNMYEVSKNFTNFGCQEVNFKDPKDKAFWSLTVYNKDGFMFDKGNHLKDTAATPNADGSFTVRLGCKGQENNMVIDNPTGAWQLVGRHYIPSEAVRNGDITLIDVKKSK